MGKQWYHEVNPAWLVARKNVVTATELRDLRSAYNKATVAEKKGIKINPTVASLWAEKHCYSVDPHSTGAAARGHFLEPYAVEEYNDSYLPFMYHWDDCLIHDGFLGFSPDAMSVKQDADKVTMHWSELEDKPEAILEIKSYSAKNHIKTALTPKGKVPERYQLAGAMAVCPTIEVAYLMLYNPDHRIGKHIFCYNRGDLSEEIKEIREIAAWVKLQFQACDNQLVLTPTIYNEDKIYEDYINQERMECSLTI